MSSIFMRFPEGKKKAVTLSYDDGVEQDIRLISIMKQYGLKGTFNLNSGSYAKEGTVYPQGTIHRRLTQNQAIELYENSGMEIAVHGLTHPFLEQLPSNLCIREIVADRENLEKQFHRIVRGMAYPFGTYNDKVIECLKQADIVYARTVNSTGDFRIPEDWLLLDPTCHHGDERLEELTHIFVEESPDRTPWLFYLWGHSYEFETDDNWDVIEKFAEYAGNRSDIWYGTNIEIYEYVNAYKKLIFSMDGSIVHNPTAIPLYFEINKTLFSIEPGKTKDLNN
ncbi:polysaccharide deacetylase family protein [Clostridium sp. Marseille-P299]|uniref:polysaccharide deacetylase family protein n=1 Tax=Clostridium sp. Marseille-P299 TaxID=1805477 RepID=UPI0008300ACA|nr:polysaccharide deacetylase family protein [Clostridium sp. Marseille-P299]